MLSSSRFIVAIHALSVLARHAGKGPVCSALVAQSVHTNPVGIRRLMGELERAKLVRSVAGRSGGFALERRADGITLADALSADLRVAARIDRATIDRLTSPENYLGLAPEMVDRVLASAKR